MVYSDRPEWSAGLEHLKGLTSPVVLDLKYFDVITGTIGTDLAQLKGLENINGLHLGNKITDAGLKHLKGLTNLTELVLSTNKVTDAGVADLQKALPNCEILH